MAKLIPYCFPFFGPHIVSYQILIAFLAYGTSDVPGLQQSSISTSICYTLYWELTYTLICSEFHQSQVHCHICTPPCHTRTSILARRCFTRTLQRCGERCSIEDQLLTQQNVNLTFLFAFKELNEKQVFSLAIVVEN